MIRIRFSRDCDSCGEDQDVFFFCDEVGSCSDCVDQPRVAKAKSAFYDRVWEELEGKVLGDWQGSSVPVYCRCRNGHICSPCPNSIQRGQGMCKTCVKKDPTATEANFRGSIAELGGVVLGLYRGSSIPVNCRCKEGHECSPRPNSIQKGQGMCKTCAERDSIAAEANFRGAIVKLGGVVLGLYRGSSIPVNCRCKEGHECSPRPTNIQSGQGMCKTCAERDSIVAEANFRAAIERFGGEVLGIYQGNHVSMECRCKEGHICSPRPNDIQQGHGMCSSCGLKSEPICREIFEELLGVTMTKQRPAWLLWKNNRALELDGYNEELKIAFEYQGAQHDSYIPHFHRNGPEDFELQQERDAFKVQACFDRGVKLIRVPCTYTYRDPDAMRKFIAETLLKSGLHHLANEENFPVVVV